MTELQDYLDFALDCAWKAGRIALGYYQTGVAVERKADNSPVTIADRGIEQMLRERITQQWPQHGIIGEEFGRIKGQSVYTWVIDPIDGTKSFAHGVPLFANLLALVNADGPLLGVMHYPALGEMIYAARGQGCFWNGRRCHVSTVDTLEDAALMTTDLDLLYDSSQAVACQRLVERTYFRRTWGDSYGYALVATGRAEIMLEPRLAVWDAAPLPVVLQEAGGIYTDWQGRVDIHSGSAVATNGVLHEQVMALIGQPKAE